MKPTFIYETVFVLIFPVYSLTVDAARNNMQ